MRLIDADALMESIRQHDYPLTAHINSTDKGMFTVGIQQAVNEMLTIDPVHVAGGCYCRECRHHTYDTTFDRHWCNRATGSCEVESNGYCSCGKRREGEAHERTD